jgi:hypothetical protein
MILAHAIALVTRGLVSPLFQRMLSSLLGDQLDGDELDGDGLDGDGGLEPQASIEMGLAKQSPSKWRQPGCVPVNVSFHGVDTSNPPACGAWLYMYTADNVSPQ